MPDNNKRMGKYVSMLLRHHPEEAGVMEIDAVRQTQATLALEELQLNQNGISEISRLVKGEITREEFQRGLKEKYQTHEER